MSKERRVISQRKIRRIKRASEESTFQLDTEISGKKTRGMAPNTKMYYTKVGFSMVTGMIGGFLYLMLDESILTDIQDFFWIMILLVGLVVCVFFVRFGLKITEDDIDQKRLWLSGTFTYVVLFIVFTSLVWMLGKTFLGF
ncbi:MAG: hypothetical protein JSV04_07200 [Candidatus Heimdallarchaeota archaeon]|nr:MAG: hypothetical protein JSV04_07200 [Candidatus Heimdallarchaeota archaeon]